MRLRLSGPLQPRRIAGGVAATGDVQVLSALRFPSNVGNGSPPGGAPLAVLRFDNPHSNGLPFRGPSGVGFTVIFWVKTRAQTGFYTNFFWGPGDGTFYTDDDCPYVGGHLYPTSGTRDGTSHEYSIAIKGANYPATLAGLTVAADHGTWRVQGMRVLVNGDGTLRARYYVNLPSTAVGDTISRDESVDYGTTQREGVDSVFMIGDAPWYLGSQHECQSGSLRAIKIVARSLTLAAMAAEAQDMSRMTSVAGLADVWYMKPGFTSPDDLTCPYTGRTFTRVDSGNQITRESP